MVMGAEREIALCICFLAFLVALGGLTFASVLVGLIFYVLGILFARRMAKSDPIMSKVWMRHIKMQIFYPSKSGIWRTK